MRPQITRIIRDLQDKDEDIATYAAMNVLRLREIREEEVWALIPVLRQATTNSNISVRFFAKKAMNEVKLQIRKYPRIAAQLDQMRDETRASSWQDLLAEITKVEVEKKLMILDLLKDVEDPQVVPALISYAGLENEEFVLAEIVKILGLIGKEDLIPTLQEFLTHKDSRVRSNAAEALEEIGGQLVVKSLVPLLNDDDNRVKGTVAKIISKYGEHNVLQTLADMLHSVEIWMRESATYALAFIPYQESVDLLLEALLDPNVEIQRKALKSISVLKPRRLHDILARLSGSADASVSVPATEALDLVRAYGKEYQYFDPESELAKNPGYRRQMSPGPKKPPQEPEPPPAPEEPKRFNFLFGRAERKRIEAERKELEDLEKVREGMQIELGKKIIGLYRTGHVDRPYLRDIDQEVKKLDYLIEQKESHRKEIKDESLRTTFINFLKDSVSRFVTEKRVEQRITSLSQRLLDTYAGLATKYMEDCKESDPEHVSLDGLPARIHKIAKQIKGIQGRLPPPPALPGAPAAAEKPEAKGAEKPETAESKPVVPEDAKSRPATPPTGPKPPTLRPRQRKNN